MVVWSDFYIFDDLIFWFFSYPKNAKNRISIKMQNFQFFLPNFIIFVHFFLFFTFFSSKSLSFIKILIFCFRYAPHDVFQQNFPNPFLKGKGKGKNSPGSHSTVIYFTWFSKISIACWANACQNINFLMKFG